jgi:hypothetical protein
VSEFGHIAFRGSGVCVDTWGAGPFVITVGDRSWRFEDSDRFGPSLVKKNGDICENPFPGQRSPFWRAHRIWVQQGRRLAEDGTTCVWGEPKPTTFYRLGKRFGMIVEAGDEDGALVEVQPPTHPEREGGAG